MIRTFEHRDVVAAHALQCSAYPEGLRDSPAAFESRLGFAAGLSLVAEIEGVLAGYILAHPWPGACPPPVDAVLGAPTEKNLVHYVHDLTIARHARGSGISQRLVDDSTTRARSVGLSRTELVAVRGAAVFWSRLGFVVVEGDPALARKIAAYGADAVFMAR